METSPLLSLRGFPHPDPLRRPSTPKPPSSQPSPAAPGPAEPSFSSSPSLFDESLSFQVEDLLDFPADDEDLVLLEEESLLTNLFSPHREEKHEGAQREKGDDRAANEQQEESLLTNLFSPHREGRHEGAQREKGDDRAANEQQVISPQEIGCQPTTSGLCAPPDELADQLEWLSTFNEDSAFLGDASLLTLQQEAVDNCAHQQEQKSQELFLSLSPVSVLEPTIGNSYTSSISKHPCVRSSVPTSRARSKRSRTGQRIWSLDALLPPLVENRLAHSNTTLINGGPPNSTRGGERSTFASSSFHDVVKHHKSFKKAKKTVPSISSKGNAGVIDGPSAKRCTHCLVQKTPQWRAGPMGPKTLCNACGVRFKSGRLVPEYRPACSPTFVNEVHSNSHKRILEMRRVKETHAYADEDLRAHDEEGNAPAEEDSHSQSHSLVQVSTLTMEESIAGHKHRHEEDEGISRPQINPGTMDTDTVPTREEEESIESSD